MAMEKKLTVTYVAACGAVVAMWTALGVFYDNIGNEVGCTLAILAAQANILGGALFLAFNKRKEHENSR